jgi:hypothetical protein
MVRFNNNTEVKVINGPHKGKTCTVRTNEGTFHIVEKDLTAK